MTEAAKAARREYQRAWREKNRDHVRQYDKMWRESNPDKTKRYRDNHWERVAARNNSE